MGRARPSAPPRDRIIGTVLVGDNGWFGPVERMPPFPYFTRDEVADVGAYLDAYPPRRSAE